MTVGPPGRGTRALAAFGVAFGAVSVVAGTRVITGVDHPDYVVLPWLVRYNVAAGVVGVIAGIGVWRGRPWGGTLASALAGAHLVVLLALVGLRVSGGAVAVDSLAAMLLRSLAWLTIAAGARRAWRSAL